MFIPMFAEDGTEISSVAVEHIVAVTPSQDASADKQWPTVVYCTHAITFVTFEAYDKVVERIKQARLYWAMSLADAEHEALRR